MRLTQKIYITAAALGFFSWILFLINIQFPKGHNFDEFHYVPSAKQFLELKTNQNWEHPPLAKELMAIGIAVGEDRPFGWRLMSTIFGSLTLVGIYFLALVLFKSEELALWTALLTLCNQLLYVQARIGMLDTFMMGFLVWALVAFCAAWSVGLRRPRIRVRLGLSGLFFGLAICCKWFAIVPWVTCLGAIYGVRLLQSWKTSFSPQRKEDWYHPDLWKNVQASDWILWLIVVPAITYAIPFLIFAVIPGSHFGPVELVLMQKKMWEGQLRVVTSHPYMSQWKEWALMNRPIWYAFDKEGSHQEWVRGVLLLGNPVIMWSGLLAILFCFWSWLKNRSRAAFLILIFYGAFYGSWIVIPRKIAFYYYYYPAGMMLSFALAYFFHEWEKSRPPIKGEVSIPRVARWIFLGGALGMFIYFFPILAALRIPTKSFTHWMWFRSWI